MFFQGLCLSDLSVKCGLQTKNMNKYFQHRELHDQKHGVCIHVLLKHEVAETEVKPDCLHPLFHLGIIFGPLLLACLVQL